MKSMVGVFFSLFFVHHVSEKNYSEEDFLRKCLRRPVFFLKFASLSPWPFYRLTLNSVKWNLSGDMEIHTHKCFGPCINIRMCLCIYCSKKWEKLSSQYIFFLLDVPELIFFFVYMYTLLRKTRFELDDQTPQNIWNIFSFKFNGESEKLINKAVTVLFLV